jgi:hypothetical protein
LKALNYPFHNNILFNLIFKRYVFSRYIIHYEIACIAITKGIFLTIALR